jgi:hypothetical protein
MSKEDVNIVLLGRKVLTEYHTNLECSPDDKEEFKEVVSEALKTMKIHPADVVMIATYGTQLVIVYYRYEFTPMKCSSQIVSEIKDGKIYTGYEIIKSLPEGRENARESRQ